MFGVNKENIMSRERLSEGAPRGASGPRRIAAAFGLSLVGLGGVLAPGVAGAEDAQPKGETVVPCTSPEFAGVPGLAELAARANRHNQLVEDLGGPGASVPNAATAAKVNAEALEIDRVFGLIDTYDGKRDRRVRVEVSTSGDEDDPAFLKAKSDAADYNRFQLETAVASVGPLIESLERELESDPDNQGYRDALDMLRDNPIDAANATAVLTQVQSFLDLGNATATKEYGEKLASQEAEKAKEAKENQESLKFNHGVLDELTKKIEENKGHLDPKLIEAHAKLTELLAKLDTATQEELAASSDEIKSLEVEIARSLKELYDNEVKASGEIPTMGDRVTTDSAEMALYTGGGRREAFREGINGPDGRPVIETLAEMTEEELRKAVVVISSRNTGGHEFPSVWDNGRHVDPKIIAEIAQVNNGEVPPEAVYDRLLKDKSDILVNLDGTVMTYEQFLESGNAVSIEIVGADGETHTIAVARSVENGAGKKHDSGSTFVIAAEDLMEAFEDAGIDPRSPDAVWRLQSVLNVPDRDGAGGSYKPASAVIVGDQPKGYTIKLVTFGNMPPAAPDDFRVTIPNFVVVAPTPDTSEESCTIKSGTVESRLAETGPGTDPRWLGLVALGITSAGVVFYRMGRRRD
jgi:polyhydroxyalkanoate synthesis regulator phasin